MKKLLLALALFLLPISAEAANRFWAPLVVSGAVSGTAGVCRLTISAITGSGQLAGDTVNVTGVTGATGCNVSTTISTVVDSTHIELSGTTFGGAYVSGGLVGGGHWNTGNTTNWSASTGGAGGASAPINGDNITFDSSSGAGTVTLDATLGGKLFGTCTADSMTNLTLDFSVNNPTISFSLFSSNSSTVRAVNFGTSNITITGAGGLNHFNFTTTTNLTATFGSSTINFVPSAFFGIPAVALNTLTYGTINFNGNGFANQYNVSGAATIGTLGFTGPLAINLPSLTITNTINWAGSSAALIEVGSQNTGGGNTLTLSAAGGAASWASFRGLTAATNSITATNSFDLKGNTNISITPPSVGGGGHIIGG